MERLEELNNRLNKSSKELADANQREDEMRSELGRKEKDLALVSMELEISLIMKSVINELMSFNRSGTS